MSRRLLGDDVLVRRTSRRLAVQAGALAAVAMLLLVTLVTVVVVREQRTATDTALRSAVATADDVGDPPAGARLVIERASRLAASSGLPVSLGEPLAALRQAAASRPTVTTVEGGSDGFRVATVRRGGAVVQAVLDLQPQARERDRLFRAVGAAGVLAVLVAAGLGVVVGRRAVRPLTRALDLQRTFVADASHELRTPLTLLSTRVQVLDRQLARAGVPDAVRADSEAVLADVARLGEVVEDLLVAADPRRDADREPVDPVALAQHVADSARDYAAEHAVAVRVEASSGPEKLALIGSLPALRRALLALVDNAIDHTPAGGTVTIGISRSGRHVVLAVADTGAGISPESADGILRRFHSGGQRAGRAHYGLGLALAHDVVNRHGGHLRLADPVPGATGTTFQLLLPASKEAPRIVGDGRVVRGGPRP